MQEQIIVIQTGNAASTGLQVSYFDTPEEATRQIEGCLEAGHPHDSINIYRATRLTMQVTQKPVVSLADSVPVPSPPQYAVDAPEAPTGEMHIPEFARFEMSPREAPPPTLPNAEPETGAQCEPATSKRKRTFWRKT